MGYLNSRWQLPAQPGGPLLTVGLVFKTNPATTQTNCRREPQSHCYPKHQAPESHTLHFHSAWGGEPHSEEDGPTLSMGADCSGQS